MLCLDTIAALIEGRDHSTRTDFSEIEEMTPVRLECPTAHLWRRVYREAAKDTDNPLL